MAGLLVGLPQALLPRSLWGPKAGLLVGLPKALLPRGLVKELLRVIGLGRHGKLRMAGGSGMARARARARAGATARARARARAKARSRAIMTTSKKARTIDFGHTGPRLAQDEPVGSYSKDIVWEELSDDDAGDDAGKPEVKETNIPEPEDINSQLPEEPKTWKNQDHSDLLREPQQPQSAVEQKHSNTQHLTVLLWVQFSRFGSYTYACV